MSVTSDPAALFSKRHASYARFIRWMRYPQGLRAFFLGSPLLRPDLRVLDAGCGTGVVSLAWLAALKRRGFAPGDLHAFDLTPAMLDHFREALQRRAIERVEIAQADVLHLDTLPAAWTDYDVIISASMLEYVPRDCFVEALGNLRARLNERGSIVLFMTRRNPLTRLLIGRWWQSILYSAAELSDAFRRAGYSRVAFRSFPPSARYLTPWGHIVEAHR